MFNTRGDTVTSGYTKDDYSARGEVFLCVATNEKSAGKFLQPYMVPTDSELVLFISVLLLLFSQRLTTNYLHYSAKTNSVSHFAHLKGIIFPEAKSFGVATMHKPCSLEKGTLRSWRSCEKAENSISCGGGEFGFWRHVERVQKKRPGRGENWRGATWRQKLNFPHSRKTVSYAG